MLESLIESLLASNQDYYVFGIHKLSEPNTVATEEEFDSVLMHLLGIDSQDNRLAMPRSNFSGLVDGSGKMDIQTLAFLNV